MSHQGGKAEEPASVTIQTRNCPCHGGMRQVWDSISIPSLSPSLPKVFITGAPEELAAGRFSKSVEVDGDRGSWEPPRTPDRADVESGHSVASRVHQVIPKWPL
jgi:hypothetical protein